MVGLSVYHHVATCRERWREVCEKLAACPVHILELPHNHEKQWHDKFREERDSWLDGPWEQLLADLQNISDSRPLKTVYTDQTYAKRDTVMLCR